MTDNLPEINVTSGPCATCGSTTGCICHSSDEYATVTSTQAWKASHTPAMKAAKEIYLLYYRWWADKVSNNPTPEQIAAIIEQHQQPSVPVSELQEIIHGAVSVQMFQASLRHLIREAEERK